MSIKKIGSSNVQEAQAISAVLENGLNLVGSSSPMRVAKLLFQLLTFSFTKKVFVPALKKNLPNLQKQFSHLRDGQSLKGSMDFVRALKVLQELTVTSLTIKRRAPGTYQYFSKGLEKAIRYGFSKKGLQVLSKGFVLVSLCILGIVGIASKHNLLPEKVQKEIGDIKDWIEKVKTAQFVSALVFLKKSSSQEKEMKSE